MNSNTKYLSSKGFTLVELLMSMAIFGIILMAVFVIYKVHQQHYANQLSVTDMQQNIRVAINVMSRDIRMAGFDDPDNPVAQIVNAEPNLFYFTNDLNEDGDVSDDGEHIVYSLYTSAGGTPTLGRTTNNAAISVSAIGAGNFQVTNPVPQAAAENIQNIEFFYLDKNGIVTTAEDQVRSVILTVVARNKFPDRDFSNTRTYNPASNLAFYNTGTLSGRSWTYNDNFRRDIQTLRVECRNVGL